MCPSSDPFTSQQIGNFRQTYLFDHGSIWRRKVTKLETLSATARLKQISETNNGCTEGQQCKYVYCDSRCGASASFRAKKRNIYTWQKKFSLFTYVFLSAYFIITPKIPLLLFFQVAIKVMDTTKIKEDYVRHNMHREAKIMGALRHPNIIRLYETLKVNQQASVCLMFMNHHWEIVSCINRV